ncbi:MAG: DUF3501 family protein [Gammaproteobacteria bacterium]|nr:DUF3501 family protein [Gammaproteobacteria bacterium]
MSNGQTPASASPATRLALADLMTLEAYARERPGFRARVLEHKRLRNVSVGPNTTWCFEDRLTVQYQIQEMLRAERIFEAEAIAEELDSYNPLIPDGTNLKATLLIEFPDPEERKGALERLKGIESRCWVGVGAERSFAIADEDLERENEQKTSAVHFLRFELPAALRAALKAGAALELGVDHPAYRHSVKLSPESSRALAADLA